MKFVIRVADRIKCSVRHTGCCHETRFAELIVFPRLLDELTNAAQISKVAKDCKACVIVMGLVKNMAQFWVLLPSQWSNT